MEKIIVKGAYENNLKHIDLEIPLNAFTCVTGCSGCGKSSLVFDTIYAESQRGFLEGMSGNLYGQKIMDKPKVEGIYNLRPALNISQNYFNVNPRSTVGTITEISYYLRSLFALLNDGIPESSFSSNNPKSFCQNCGGLGYETIISEDLILPDKDKTLSDGAILYFSGSKTSKEYMSLVALCEYYNIDINKKAKDLSKDEINKLLYSDDKIKYKISYREGKRRKQHYVFLQGAIASIKEKLSHLDLSPDSALYSNYMEKVLCHVCNGLKLNNDILSYRISNNNIAQVEQLELTKIKEWTLGALDSVKSKTKRELVSQLVEIVNKRVSSLIQLNVGYLNLSRSIPTLSGGERQRIRIATQLNCSLKDLIYILDEPCKGLHSKDIASIVNATKNLIRTGNTVISIEHNKQYISEADNVIELGPEGGPNGGYLISVGKNKSQNIEKLNFKNVKEPSNFFELKNISFRNIKNQSVSIPIGKITCITGVSGSGKTSLTHVISKCFERKTNVYCDYFDGDKNIRRIMLVNQNPIGKTPRSTIVSYLEIFDEIRDLFASTAQARAEKLKPSFFSMNVRGGRCETCMGTGVQKIELNYLPSSYITCPDCDGKRYAERILDIKYKNYSIQEVLDAPIVEIIKIFEDNKKVYSILNCMVSIGLGYLKLGQMSMNLSGGEAQRVKLAKALGVSSNGKGIYILDEPTSGLNSADVKKFVDIILKLQDNGETIIIIEHNLEFIAEVADYVIDFGNKGGEEGGKIVSIGKPENVLNDKNSSWYGLF